MEHHQNQNAFTWKMMKPTVCITVQYKCDRDEFQSQRGCRKHVNTEHSWFFYFAEKPNSKEITDLLKLASNFPIESTIQERTRETTKLAVKLLPSFLTWEIFIIFQVVVVARIHSITPSRTVRHLETRGSSHMKRQGMLVGKFEFNSHRRIMWTLP